MSTISITKPKSASLPRVEPRRRERPALEAMFSPRLVAVVGATETAGSVGRTILENLMAQRNLVGPKARAPLASPRSPHKACT